jgi:hypothetical protein
MWDGMKRSWRDSGGVALLFGVVVSFCLLLCLEGVFFLLNHWSIGPWPQFKLIGSRRAAVAVKSPRKFARASHFLLQEVVNRSKTSFSYNNTALDYSQKFVPLNSHSTEGRIQSGMRVSAKVTKADSGKLIYEAMYTFDGEGRRTTTGLDQGARTRHLILLGCSLVFGEGLNDDQTLGSFIAGIAKNHRIYNLGEPGGSPVRIVERIQQKTLWTGIQEPQGVAVFVLFNDHMNRFLGSLSVAGDWGSQLPYAYEKSPGQFVVEGTFETARPLLTSLYRFLFKSQIRKYFGMNLPWKYSRENYQAFGRMILQIKNDYLTRFPGQKFYVLIHPFNGDEAFVTQISDEFENLGIEYFDYSPFKLSRFSEQPVQFELDGHPNAEANRIMAPIMAKDLGLMEP